MRIISGVYRGSKLYSLNGMSTRPTQDRVKESVFNMISHYIYNSNCLDLFAGSGSIGFEFLSRGASNCTFVDKNPKAIEIIKKNQTKLKAGGKIVNQDYAYFLDLAKARAEKFDIVYIDPPFKESLHAECIEKLINYNLLSNDAIVVCETNIEFPIPDSVNINFSETKTKKYGNITVSIYYKE